MIEELEMLTTTVEPMRDTSATGTLPVGIPSFLELEITGFCQLKCIHCYAESGPHGGRGTMTTDNWEHVIDQAAAIGVGGRTAGAGRACGDRERGGSHSERGYAAGGAVSRPVGRCGGHTDDTSSSAMGRHCGGPVLTWRCAGPSRYQRTGYAEGLPAVRGRGRRDSPRSRRGWRGRC
jgi:hypothetical protein